VPVSDKDLRELFKKPAVKEVACEIRFTPRLRIIPEVWRVQDRLAESYPQVGEEQAPQADGRILHSYVFGDPTGQRVVKLSQENFVLIVNKYVSFEQFKKETLVRITEFCKEFDITTFQRVGLRYVNHIELPAKDGISLLQRYVNAPVDFDRFRPETIEQFLTEFRLRTGEYKLTVRGVLLQLPNNTEQLLYILDLDCFVTTPQGISSLERLIDDFHHEIQIQFLEHVTADFKEVMRG
jgi:uncharacterized protein (TIGR04255 family)